MLYPLSYEGHEGGMIGPTRRAAPERIRAAATLR